MAAITGDDSKESPMTNIKMNQCRYKLHAVSHFTTVKAKDETFMKGIWDECLNEGLPQLALNSNFWQGMSSGTLDADDYGKFTVQDVAYCANSADTWATAASKASKNKETELSDYLVTKFVSNRDYGKSLKNAWGIEPTGVIINESTEMYTLTEEYVVNKFGEYYCPVANYACYKLWPYIGNTLFPEMKKKKETLGDKYINVYYDFIKDNYDPTYSSATKLENQINNSHDQGFVKKDICLNVVKACLYCETYMAYNATGQTMTKKFPFPEWLQ